MENFNALLTLSELKTLYSGKPVGICPLYKGTIGTTKTFEATGNPITIPEYKSLVKLTTQFSPKQAGSGDPSPENVRPISGWDSVKVTVSNESESHDYDIALPETIYGGTVDAVTGEGEKTWAFECLDGTVKGNYNREYNSIYIVTKYQGEKNSIVISSHIKNAKIINTAFYLMFFASALSGIEISAFSDVQSYFAAQASAGTPVQIAYKLATPESFEVPQVSIPSLGGENKFFTNAENMDIIYNETSFWG